MRERASVVGTGGLDITNVLKTTADKLGVWWGSLAPTQSRSYYDRMYSSENGWDATPLQGNFVNQQTQFSGGAANWAPRSVTVAGGVYYAHEVNYFYWGYMNAEASKKGASVTEDSMIEWVAGYRLAYGPWFPNWFGSVHDGSLYGRAAWASAGWHYSKTGTLKPPTVVSLPNATPSNSAYAGFSQGMFGINIGGFRVPLN